MKRFIIEQNVPGACELTEAQLAEIAQKAIATTRSLGVPHRWVTSYVAGDKIYGIHEAEDEDVVREHCRRGAFTTVVVAEIAGEFGPGEP
jgi:hypothetical protein